MAKLTKKREIKNTELGMQKETSYGSYNIKIIIRNIMNNFKPIHYKFIFVHLTKCTNLLENTMKQIATTRNRRSV